MNWHQNWVFLFMFFCNYHDSLSLFLVCLAFWPSWSFSLLSLGLPSTSLRIFHVLPPQASYSRNHLNSELIHGKVQLTGCPRKQLSWGVLHAALKKIHETWQYESKSMPSFTRIAAVSPIWDQSPVPSLHEGPTTSAGQCAGNCGTTAITSQTCDQWDWRPDSLSDLSGWFLPNLKPMHAHTLQIWTSKMNKWKHAPMNERPNEQVLRRKKKHQRILLKRKQKDRQTDKHDITRHIDKLIDT